MSSQLLDKIEKAKHLVSENDKREFLILKDRSTAFDDQLNQGWFNIFYAEFYTMDRHTLDALNEVDHARNDV